MVKVSLRSMLVNKLRLFLTIAAVTIGVAFVSGTPWERRSTACTPA
jgi:putative ABC transport system permease protein